MNHLRWDGHSLLVEYLQQLTQICRCVHFASNTSVQLVPLLCSIGFKLIWGLGRPGENFNVVLSEELYGVMCCMGCGIVVLKYTAIQRLMSEIKQQKKICVSVFEQYMF